MIHQTIIPEDKTVTLSFTVPENYIGQEVEVVAFIRDKEMVSNDLPANVSSALQGKTMTNVEFTNWIEQAEHMSTITLQEARSKWESKKQQLQQPIK